ncbi:MAG: hypothetical protein NZ822_00395 [Patescibacteria group bacterium]|nr:hypothetical protein [Patescibacteria group bacterium]
MKIIKAISILVLIILWLSIAFGQVMYDKPKAEKDEPMAYFFYQPIRKGIMIGVEIINFKNGKTILTDKEGSYVYRWLIKTDTEEISKQSDSNVVFFLLNSRFNNFSVEVSVYPLLGRDQPLYTFRQDIVLPEPRLKMVKISGGLTLPFDGQLASNDILTFKFENFISPPDRVMWYLNEGFISNKRDISYEDLNSRSGILKLQVFSKLNEKAMEIKPIRF